MEQNVFDVLKERGFIEQTTHEAEIRELLLELKAAGKTILLASHNEEDIRILCDHVYEMDGGILKERTG